MSSVTATAATPHFRVSAAKNQQTSDNELSTRIAPPGQSSIEDKFFWTYTEEPHRSRRQAIIKAHPEVPSPQTQAHCRRSLTTDQTGNEALRTRTYHEICRPGRRLSANMLRLPPPQHVHALMALHRDRILHRSNFQPEPLPRHP